MNILLFVLSILSCPIILKELYISLSLDKSIVSRATEFKFTYRYFNQFTVNSALK